MTMIKLEHSTVIKQLEEMEAALKEVKIDSLPQSSLGNNLTEYTKMWLQHEETVHKTAMSYVEAVLKNIQDTKDNVTYLREQDEAITAE